MQALQQEYRQQRLKNSQEELRRRQEVITTVRRLGSTLAERQNLIFGGVRGIPERQKRRRMTCPPAWT